MTASAAWAFEVGLVVTVRGLAALRTNPGIWVADQESEECHALSPSAICVGSSPSPRIGSISWAISMMDWAGIPPAQSANCSANAWASAEREVALSVAIRFSARVPPDSRALAR